MKKNDLKQQVKKIGIIPCSSWNVTDEQKVSIHHFPAAPAVSTLAFNIVYLEFRQETRHRNFSAFSLRILDSANQPNLI
jgi:hypothetical protein